MRRILYSMTSAFFLMLVFLSLGQGCSPSFTTENSNDVSSLGFVQKSCAPPAGISGSPKTIEEAVALINSLPRPVTVSCFLESLDRPLNVSLTNNEVSAQAAVGSRSPRIFIMIENLFISVVPEGLGSDFVELSYLTAPDMSVKAEIEFPVVQAISAKSPYESVLYGAGTNCSFCHKGERRYTSIGFATAYESKALQPAVETLVDLDQFRKELILCNPQNEPKRCAMIQALFNNGQVLSKKFPSSIPYNF